MTCPGNPVDWDESVLSLGKPSLMDTPTFLEWTRQEMETAEETRKRHEDLDRQHRQWHINTPHYISACYVNMKVSDLNGFEITEGVISATKFTTGVIRFNG